MSALDQDTCVRVALRIRPLNDDEILAKEDPCIKPIVGENQVVVGNDLYFTFDHIFGTSSSQKDIYKECVSDLLSSTFEGFNATILAYGQTGSGKSYTMGLGVDNNQSTECSGIIPRALKELFDTIAQKTSTDSQNQYTVKIQFLEIYGEDIHDLTDNNQNKIKELKIAIREAANGDIFITGVQEIIVHNVEMAMNVLEIGSKNRVTSATGMNSVSSRSHAIFTIILENSYTLQSVGGKRTKKRRCQFHFVDLAGSERTKRTNARGLQLKEGIDINRGLLALGNVISALGDEKKRGRVHVPYRDSKLTRFLQNSLGGNSKTLFLCCVSPTECNFIESVSSLKYANRARNIHNKPVITMDPAVQAMNCLHDLVQNLASQLLSTMNPVHLTDNPPDHQPFTAQSLTELLQKNKEIQTIVSSVNAANKSNAASTNHLKSSRKLLLLMSPPTTPLRRNQATTQLFASPTQTLDMASLAPKRRSSFGLMSPSRQELN